MSVYTINRAHILCSSFAFYGFEPLVGDGARAWFDYCLSTAEKIGPYFDEGCCSPGNAEYVLMKSCKKALDRNIDGVEYVELRSLTDEDIGSYGEAYASFENKNKESFWGIRRDFVSRDFMFEIGKRLCKIIQPKYGIFYDMPFVYSPDLYVDGMGNGEFDTEEYSKLYNEKHVDAVKRRRIWRINFCKYVDNCSSGHLREIYPINFINENHLKYEIFPRIALKDWILAEDHRGKLEQITDELWAWTIEDADLEGVTIALAKSDICLCVNKENPHRYDYGVRPEDQIKIIPWKDRPENQ